MVWNGRQSGARTCRNLPQDVSQWYPQVGHPVYKHVGGLKWTGGSKRVGGLKRTGGLQAFILGTSISETMLSGSNHKRNHNKNASLCNLDDAFPSGFQFDSIGRFALQSDPICQPFSGPKTHLRNWLESLRKGWWNEETESLHGNPDFLWRARGVAQPSLKEAEGTCSFQYSRTSVLPELWHPLLGD